jgi:hypothetical protein
MSLSTANGGNSPHTVVYLLLSEMRRTASLRDYVRWSTAIVAISYPSRPRGCSMLEAGSLLHRRLPIGEAYGRRVAFAAVAPGDSYLAPGSGCGLDHCGRNSPQLSNRSCVGAEHSHHAASRCLGRASRAHHGWRLSFPGCAGRMDCMATRISPWLPGCHDQPGLPNRRRRCGQQPPPDPAGKTNGSSPSQVLRGLRARI